MNSQHVFEYLQGLQNRIVEAIQLLDGKPFLHDSWQRPEGGGGTVCILEQGNVFERAGIGFSRVFGSKLPPAASAAHPEVAGRSWEAMGVSLVFHPRNPYIPTVHMNVRFFVTRPRQAAGQTEGDQPGAQDVWWFGGGMDLTPYYGFEEDAIHFHRVCRDALQPFGPNLYTEFKTACDDYFYLKHRQEARGVGGIFFDDFNRLDFTHSLAMTQSVGDAFLHAYLPIVQRRKDVSFGERERDFQAYRRGRYVEFNLVLDRGTLFGLQSNGRTESILLSMPPTANWRYDWKPAAGSPESRLYSDFLPLRDWLGQR